ncbi:MAG: CRISPR-associated protein Cas4 [Eubacteriales bacterium]
MSYNEEEYLMLSGLQHFRFCRRQWALIHIENQWSENFRTVDGEIIHEKAHNEALTESRGDTVITRGVSVFSAELGVSGQCDVLEYRKGHKGIPLRGREDLWMPFPVEYKRGSPREDTGDTLQLCGQAMCLEEMLCCDIPQGALYYHEIRRRVPVDFNEALRTQVRTYLSEMHELYRRRYTPKVKPSKSCNACSLKELCVPRLMKTGSVSDYINAARSEDR